MVDTQQPCKDGDSSALLESLQSLLKQPRFTSPEEFPSFEVPFDDPEMEPLPFRQAQDQSFITRPIVVFGNRRFSNLPTTQQNALGKDGGTLSRIAVSQHGDDDCSYNRQSNHSQVADRIRRVRPYQDKKWKESFQRLLKFKREHGHCCVPHLYAEDPALGRWVKRQRQEYQKQRNSGPKASNLTTTRIEELESIGFVWHAHAVAWLQKVDELKEYKHKTGDCNVPSLYPENTALATWVKSQRRQYKLLVSGIQSTMTTDRYRVLSDMGFVFVRRRPFLFSRRPSWI